MFCTKKLFSIAAIGAGILGSNPGICANLLDMVNVALENHPRVQASKSGVDIAKYQKQQQFSQYFPQASVQFLRARERTHTASITPHVWLQRHENTFDISQSIFEGGSIYFSNQAAAKALDAKVLNALATENEICYDVVIAYFEYMRQTQRNKLSLHNLDVHKDIQKKISTRYEKGAGKAVEVQLANSRTKRAQNQQAEIADKIDIARVKFISTTGVEPRNLTIPKSLAKFSKGSLESFNNIAKSNSKAILASKASVESADKEIKQAKAAFAPKLKFTARGGKDRNIDGTRGKNHDMIAGFSMSYDLFKGGADFAALSEAKAKRAESLDNLSDTTRLTLENTGTAWEEMESAVRREKIAKEHVEYATQVLESYKKLFEFGQIELFNLLDAENELYSAKLTRVDITYERLQAEHKLAFATNNLLNHLQEMYSPSVSKTRLMSNADATATKYKHKKANLAASERATLIQELKQEKLKAKQQKLAATQPRKNTKEANANKQQNNNIAAKEQASAPAKPASAQVNSPADNAFDNPYSAKANTPADNSQKATEPKKAATTTQKVTKDNAKTIANSVVPKELLQELQKGTGRARRS